MPVSNTGQQNDAIYPGLLFKSLKAYRKVDFSVHLPEDLAGVDGEIAEAFNDVEGLERIDGLFK